MTRAIKICRFFPIRSFELLFVVPFLQLKVVFVPVVGVKSMGLNNLGMGLEVKLARALESWVRTQSCEARRLSSQQLCDPKRLFLYLAQFHFFICKIVPIFENTLKNKKSPSCLLFPLPNTCIYNYLVECVCLISLNWEGCLDWISIWRWHWVLSSYHCCVCQNVPLPERG